MTAISLAPAGPVGLTAELGALFDLIDRVREGDRLGLLARDRDVQVLSTAGAQSEAEVPFSGLHQLLCNEARLVLLGTPAQNLRKG
jgi:hypothetical protein